MRPKRVLNIHNTNVDVIKTLFKKSEDCNLGPGSNWTSVLDLKCNLEKLTDDLAKKLGGGGHKVMCRYDRVTQKLEFGWLESDAEYQDAVRKEKIRELQEIKVKLNQMDELEQRMKELEFEFKFI
jgi:hypothetical protein